jgi:mycofactocin precursor
MSEPNTHAEDPDLPASTADAADAADELIADDELLVEDVSIDGMCGVY